LARLLTVTLVLSSALILSPAASAEAQAPPAVGAAGSDAQAGGGGSGGEWWSFADKIYYEPLLAEQRAARIFLLFPGWSSALPHSRESGSRFAWQVVMGREIPMVGRQSDSVGRERFEPGKWGIGLWIPISFHMLEDFKDESNPIVDTDYRFGMMAKAQVGLAQNWTLSIRFVPWAHESTHLGDEYTIFASADPAFERINVSYEYREYGISLERAFPRSSLLTLRHGGISLWGSDGYYSDHLLESNVPTLSVSRKNYEPSFGVEYRLPTDGGRQLVVSLDVRNRLQYSFHHPTSGEERRRPTWTLAVGHAAREGDVPFFRSVFGYVTRGVNPFGQLREQHPFWAAGVGWIFQ
jgi:hypothetical protein